MPKFYGPHLGLQIVRRVASCPDFRFKTVAWAPGTEMDFSWSKDAKAEDWNPRDVWWHDTWWPLTCLFPADPCWSMLTACPCPHIAWILNLPCEFKVSQHVSACLSMSQHLIECLIQTHAGYAQHAGTHWRYLSCRPSKWKTAFVLKSVSYNVSTSSNGNDYIQDPEISLKHPSGSFTVAKQGGPENPKAGRHTAHFF